jgi:hypothetical protein
MQHERPRLRNDIEVGISSRCGRWHLTSRGSLERLPQAASMCALSPDIRAFNISGAAGYMYRQHAIQSGTIGVYARFVVHGEPLSASRPCGISRHCTRRGR